jgi:hypothetical protein
MECVCGSACLEEGAGRSAHAIPGALAGTPHFLLRRREGTVICNQLLGAVALKHGSQN